MTTTTMSKDQLHEFLKRAKGSIASALARAPATLFFLASAAAMPMTEARAWGAQYEKIGREVGRELGREVTNGGRDGAGRLAVMIGGVLGSAVARPMDEKAKAEEKAAREAARQEQIAARDAAANQRRLERAEMQGKEQAIREASYQAQRAAMQGAAVVSPAAAPKEITAPVVAPKRWSRVTPGASSSYSSMSGAAQVAVTNFKQGANVHQIQSPQRVDRFVQRQR